MNCGARSGNVAESGRVARCLFPEPLGRRASPTERTERAKEVINTDNGATQNTLGQAWLFFFQSTLRTSQNFSLHSKL